LKASKDQSTAPTYWMKYAEAADLIGLHLDGDRDAFELLIEHSEWRTGYAKVRVNDNSEMDDVLQDARTRLYKALPDYNPAISSFRTFAEPHVEWAIRDYVRKKARRPLLVDDLT